MFKVILDSLAWILDFMLCVDFEFQVLDSLSLKLGIRIPVVTAISVSLTCIPDSKPRILDPMTQISRILNFNRRRFPEFHIPRKKNFAGSLATGDLSNETESNLVTCINAIMVTKSRLIIFITLHILNNYWMRFL